MGGAGHRNQVWPRAWIGCILVLGVRRSGMRSGTSVPAVWSSVN